MPNWVYCTLEITGDEAELQRFIAPVKEHKSILDAYMPMPEELRGGQSPVLIAENPDEYVAKWLAKHNTYRVSQGMPPMDAPDEFAPKPITEETRRRWVETYGTDNWYDWTRNTWGVKWSEGDLRIIEEEDRLTLVYQLPWTIASGYDAIFAKFQALSFRLKWVEESCESAGTIYWDNDDDEPRREYRVE